ncbi:MAG: hypothetical protein ACFFBV_16490, partial [Promethearchaeota archaeon]
TTDDESAASGWTQATTGSSVAFTVDATGGAIYYSVGTSRQTETDLKNASTVTIVSGTATFSEPQPYNIGVGDEVNYGEGAGTNVYISGRSSPTVYSVTTGTGAVPTNVTEPATVNSIKRAFGSLSAAETSSGDGSHLGTFDLTSGNGYQLNLVCYADGDGEMTDSPVEILGWTTGPNNYIRIYTPTSTSEVGESQRHDGTWGTGFRLRPSSGTPIAVYEDYVRIEGIAMQAAASAACISVSGMSTNNDVRISHCLMVGQGTGGSTRGLIANDTELNLTVWNTIAYNNYGWQNFYVANCTTAYFYNCTAYNSSGGQGFRTLDTNPGTVTVKNCISMANNYDFYPSAEFDASSDYNMSSDTTAPGTNSLKSKIAANQFVSLTAGSEDLHLKTGSDAIDKVTTDPPTSFTNDIDGDTRPVGTYWDMGADEYIARSLTLANHGSGQVGDKFTTTESVTDVLFRFKLTRTGTVTVDELKVHFTYDDGVLNSDVSNGELWVDKNNDGVIDSGDTMIEGSVTPE